MTNPNNNPTNPTNQPDIDLSKLTPEEKIDLLKLLDEKDRIAGDKLVNFVPSLIQEAALCSRAKIIIVLGGNQSGKSEVGGMRVSICSTGIVPKVLQGKFPEHLLRHGAYWCSALDYGGARDIIKFKLDDILNGKLDHYSKEDKIYTLKNNWGTIGLKSEESRRGKYQGVQRYGVWMDEEHTKDVYDEIFERVTTLQGFIFFTFSPVEGLTWSYDNLYKRAKKVHYTKNVHGIPEEVGILHTLEEVAKLKDRKLIIQENNEEFADPNIEVFIISKYDNSYLADVEIQNSERKYLDDPSQYQSRVLGRYSRISNRNVFDKEALFKLQSRVPSKCKKGNIINGQFKENLRGNLTIFTEKLKKDNGCYIVGADVAEGLESGDFSCAVVLDRRTCEQVAIWHGHCPPEEFGRILLDIGVFFNHAFIAPERNFHGFGVVNYLRDKKYRRLYYDRDRGAEAIKRNHTGQKTYGWETNARTKPILVQTLASFIRDKHIRINDMNTIDELTTYIYNKDGQTGAMGGCFDDRVIALGIALQLFLNTPITTNMQDEKTYHSNAEIDNSMGY